ATTVTLTTRDENVVINDYFKYGKELNNHTDHWYEFLFDRAACEAQANLQPGDTGYDPDACTGAEIINDAQGHLASIVLHLIDSQRGDDDFTKNGIITDPGGPALFVPQLAIVGASSTAEAAVYSLQLQASGQGSDLVTGWNIAWGDGAT